MASSCPPRNVRLVCRVFDIASCTVSFMAVWTFFTNHAHVLFCLSADPHVRLRDVATRVGVTERAAQRIVADLVEAGNVERTRDGRRNHYYVSRDLPLRHPIEQSHHIGEIIAVLEDPQGPASHQ